MSSSWTLWYLSGVLRNATLSYSCDEVKFLFPTLQGLALVMKDYSLFIKDTASIKQKP